MKTGWRSTGAEGACQAVFPNDERLSPLRGRLLLEGNDGSGTRAAAPTAMRRIPAWPNSSGCANLSPVFAREAEGNNRAAAALAPFPGTPAS